MTAASPDRCRVDVSKTRWWQRRWTFFAPLRREWCALAPGRPIYMASDSPRAIEFARNHTMKVSHQPLVWRVPDPDPPLHMEFGESHRVSDFYDTFVDLYLLSLGGCVTYGIGGFGKWSAFIGGHWDCVHRIREEEICVLPTEKNEAVDLVDASSFNYDLPIWPLPMEDIPLYAASK